MTTLNTSETRFDPFPLRSTIAEKRDAETLLFWIKANDELAKALSK